MSLDLIDYSRPRWLQHWLNTQVLRCAVGMQHGDL